MCQMNLNLQKANFLFQTQTDWYQIWNSNGKVANTSFSEIGVSEHPRKRKQVAKAYGMTSILKMEEYIQAVIDQSRETCWDPPWSIPGMHMHVF